MLEPVLRSIGRQRWLRFGIRNRLLRWLRDPAHAIHRDFEVEFAGYVYAGNTGRLIDWIVYYFGAYELDELELMRSLLADRARPVALDVGANVGHHTLYLASFCAQVHAFEPYAEVSRHLDEKLRRNAIEHVQVHRVGLGDRDQEAEFFAPSGINTGTGSFVASHEAANNRPVGRLEVRSADAYLARLELPSLDLVKIDVEGFELSVLKGLDETLRRHHPIVMMELSDSARISLPDAAAFMALLPQGYRADVVRSQRSVLGLLGRPGCSLEPLQWHHRPLPGGYMNLLLRFQPQGEPR